MFLPSTKPWRNADKTFIVSANSTTRSQMCSVLALPVILPTPPVAKNVRPCPVAGKKSAASGKKNPARHRSVVARIVSPDVPPSYKVAKKVVFSGAQRTTTTRDTSCPIVYSGVSGDGGRHVSSPLTPG